MNDATGRWVTDAGDHRVGLYTCIARCADGKVRGCYASLSTPFYELEGVDEYTLCPACALAHFGVRPPGTEATECGHAADDEGCRCWGLRNLTTGQMCRAGGFVAHVDRAARWPDECAIWAGSSADATRYAKAMRRAHGGHAYGAQRHSTLTFAPTPAIDIDPEHYAGPERCHLDWCSAPTRSTFCSDRCQDYDTKRIAIYHRLESYKTKLARHADKGMTKAAEVALASEITWAEQQTKSEVEALERQWRALTWR